MYEIEIIATRAHQDKKVMELRNLIKSISDPARIDYPMVPPNYLYQDGEERNYLVKGLVSMLFERVVWSGDIDECTSLNYMRRVMDHGGSVYDYVVREIALTAMDALINGRVAVRPLTDKDDQWFFLNSINTPWKFYNINETLNHLKDIHVTPPQIWRNSDDISTLLKGVVWYNLMGIPQGNYTTETFTKCAQKLSSPGKLVTLAVVEKIRDDLKFNVDEPMANPFIKLFRDTYDVDKIYKFVDRVLNRNFKLSWTVINNNGTYNDDPHGYLRALILNWILVKYPGWSERVVEFDGLNIHMHTVLEHIIDQHNHSITRTLKLVVRELLNNHKLTPMEVLTPVFAFVTKGVRESMTPPVCGDLHKLVHERIELDRLNNGVFKEYNVEFITDPIRLYNEGSKMKHCVGGSGYIDDLVDGSMLFFHLDNGTHHGLTVTFDVEEGYGTGYRGFDYRGKWLKISVDDYNGYCNESTEEDGEIVEDLFLVLTDPRDEYPVKVSENQIDNGAEYLEYPDKNLLIFENLEKGREFIRVCQDLKESHWVSLDTVKQVSGHFNGHWHVKPGTLAGDLYPTGELRSQSGHGGAPDDISSLLSTLFRHNVNSMYGAFSSNSSRGKKPLIRLSNHVFSYPKGIKVEKDLVDWKEKYLDDGFLSTSSLPRIRNPEARVAIAQAMEVYRKCLEM